MSTMRAEVAVGTLAEIVDEIPRKFRSSGATIADMSSKAIGVSTSSETIRNGGKITGSTLDNAAKESGIIMTGSTNITQSRTGGVPAALRLSALFESGDSLVKRRSCSEVTDEATSTLPVSNIQPVITRTDAGNTYVTSVTVTRTKSSEPSKDTHVVKSVYTTKTGNSTRVFTVETTTDSVTRRNSMAVSTGALPPTTSIVNEQPITASPSNTVLTRESFHRVVPAQTISEEDSVPATRSVATKEEPRAPENHGSQTETPSNRLTQNEDFSAFRRGDPSTSSKNTPAPEEQPKTSGGGVAGTGNEQRGGLAGMQFCNFLFRKGRVRPRAFRPLRGPPVFSSPASSPPTSPSSPLPTSSSPAQGDVCVAVVASPLDASSVEVIDHRSKNIEQILEILKKGTQLWKIRSFTKWYRRSYYLDDKEGTVRYEPSHKAPCMNSPLKIAIDDIIDVRKGWKTDTFNKIEQKVERRKIKFPSQPSPVDERCCFSIIYSNNKQSLDLCAPEPKVADMWVRGLRHILTALKGLYQEERFERWLEHQFCESDVDKNNGLNFEESLKLLKHLNVKMPSSSVKKIFDEANTVKHSKNGEQVLDVDEFVSFYMKLMSRSEIKEIYLRYCKNNKEMTALDLMDFIHKEQKGQDTTKEECLSFIEAFEQSNMKAEGKLSLIGFTNMLMSEQFDVLKQYHKVVYQDMHQPLSHYYIATSHNTYLTGNQLHGDSSVEGYIDALKQGCRCVELDCWDGPDGEPIIYHGYTLTSKILFKDVLVDAIKPYAFHASEYPVILSLENHLSPKQQEVLTKHLTGILGDMLYTKPVVESMEFLPSPEDLKHKVIVKAKKKSSRSAEDGEESNSEDEMTSPPDIEPAKNDIKKVKAEVISGLSSLVNVCEAVHFHSFEDTEANKKCYQMSSFSEAKANKFIETKGREFVNYNTKHLSRIYPAGTRTDSSNFKPIPYWNMGCQLVALNYQHSGKPMLYNDAKFQDNGGCGFVLKPEYLRKRGYNPENTLNDRNQVTLKLTVISGQHIPKADQDTDGEIVDPYVKVKIIGHPRDNQKLKTEAVRNNGFNPIWNNEMTFNIKMPELAIIHFIVKDLSNTGKDVTLGTYAIPFLSLQEGYSHVYLKDYYRNFVSPASLFIHVCVI